MRVGLNHLQPDYYLLLRWFGKNYLYKVVERPEFKGWRGWRVRVRRASLARDLFEEQRYQRADRLGLAREFYIFRLPFYARLSQWLDPLFGCPRWHGFWDRAAVREHLQENPNTGLFDLVEKAAARWLPPRAAAMAIAFASVVALTFFPIYGLSDQDEEEL